MELIAVFDFDGTLIKKDSMILFFQKNFSLSLKNLLIFLRLILHTIKYFLKIYSRRQYKEIYINHVISLSRSRDHKKSFNNFSEYLLGLILKDAVGKIEELKEKGYYTILMSASPDLYLKTVSKKLGFSELICTETIFKDNYIKIRGLNCYGKNKILMLLERHEKGKIDWNASYCFSDSHTDMELLNLFGNPYIVNNRKLSRSSGIDHVPWE